MFIEWLCPETDYESRQTKIPNEDNITCFEHLSILDVEIFKGDEIPNKYI